MKKAIIFGVSDFAEVAQTYLSADSPYRVEAFTVHERYIEQPTLLGLPVVPFETLTERYSPDEYEMYTAIGFSKVNRRRTEVYEECKSKGYKMLTYVNSRAAQWGNVEIGDNCFIFEHNTIQPFVKIGNNVVVWSGNHIGHHTTIGDNCFIASHAVISGHVTIGNNCFIGVNSTFRDGVTIGSECVIGAGANILRDAPDKAVYKGANTEAAAVKSDELRNF